MESESDSVLISDDSSVSQHVIVHKRGVRSKKKHRSRQVSAGEGFSVDVADEASFKNYVFVNGDEYGLFDEGRRFVQMIVCYQVLSTQWNSRTQQNPSSLKPRYLFLFRDALFVMKLHDTTDTNVPRYRVLGRLALGDVTVAEVGDDMFDVLARGTGALRFAVGSDVTRTQAVTLVRRLVRREQRAHAAARPLVSDVPVPSNPDDVFETMNYALAILEKKMRGTATEEERWQADTLLRHAMDMQERRFGPRTTTLLSGGGGGGGGGASTAALPASSGSAEGSLRARLEAREAQLRATEERCAIAETALARTQGASGADDSEQRNLVLENRRLRGDTERLRAQLEEAERQLAVARQELQQSRTSTVGAADDVAYHQGSADEILSRIQRAPPVDEGPSTHTRDSMDAARREAAAREADRRAEDRHAEEQRAAAAAAAEEQRLQREAEEQRRRQQEWEEEQQRQQREAAAEEARIAEDELKSRTPVAVIPPMVPKAASESSSEPLTDGSEEMSSMSLSSDMSGGIGIEDDDLSAFLKQHELEHLYDRLDDAGVSLAGLQIMDVENIRSLPNLDYAEASHLCTALGLKNIFE